MPPSATPHSPSQPADSVVTAATSVNLKGDFGENVRERATRIELAFSAWEADVLPLNYAREWGDDSKAPVIPRRG
jgi:hypothetical protein